MKCCIDCHILINNIEKLLSIDLHATANQKYYVCTFSHYYFFKRKLYLYRLNFKYKLLKSNKIIDDNIHLKHGADAYIKTPQEMWFAMTWERF